MTKAQSQSLHEARHKGKHFMMSPMTKHQMRHNLTAGSIFTTALKYLKKPLGALIKKGIDLGGAKLKQYAPAVIGKVAAKAGQYIGHGNAAKLAKLAQEHAHKGIDKLGELGKSQLSKKGFGVKSSRKGGKLGISIGTWNL